MAPLNDEKGKNMAPTPLHADTGECAVGVWFSEPSIAAAEIAAQAGFSAAVLDIEHGSFDLHALQWFIPAIKGLGLRVIAKVLAPERGPIQQALDFGAHAVAIPHVESAAHARELSAFAKFPSRGLRSFAGGHTSAYAGFDDQWVARQDAETHCYPMIEDASALAEIDEILALDNVDGVFIGPSDLSLSRGRGAYRAGDEDMADLLRIAQAATQANKPWIIPAWSEKEQEFAVAHRAGLAVVTQQYGALRSGFSAGVEKFMDITKAVRKDQQ